MSVNKKRVQTALGWLRQKMQKTEKLSFEKCMEETIYEKAYRKEHFKQIRRRARQRAREDARKPSGGGGKTLSQVLKHLEKVAKSPSPFVFDLGESKAGKKNGRKRRRKGK